jgi:hypothetical protein
VDPDPEKVTHKKEISEVVYVLFERPEAFPVA